MEQYTNSIALLLQHGQRFFEIWNFQIILAIAAVGFIMSHEGLTARDRVRINITVVFVLIAIFSVYTLSVHHERELLLWNAIQSRIDASSSLLTPAEMEYIATLEPMDFFRKAAALVIADLIVIGITWLSPRMRQE
jgi:hypothetical protein